MRLNPAQKVREKPRMALKCKNKQQPTNQYLTEKPKVLA